MNRELHSKKLGAAALLRSARGSAARLPPSEVGEFGDFTVRAVVRRKVNATECIDTVYVQKKHSRSDTFSTGCSEKYASFESDFSLPKLTVRPHGGLENPCTSNRTVGSNPTLSASYH